MSYVDKADMLKSIYEIDRKSHKWWHRIFFHLLDVTVVNSCIIYQNLLKENLPPKSSKISVIHWLAGDSGMASKNMSIKITSIEMSTSISTAKRHKTTMPNESRLSETPHIPLILDNIQRRCNLCSTKNDFADFPYAKSHYARIKIVVFHKFHTNKLL